MNEFSPNPGGEAVTQQQIFDHLCPLIGLRLSASYRAADMRIFHFGILKPAHNRGQVGEFALHVQCPWRIECPEGILTGRYDLFEPAEMHEGFEYENWDWDGNETLQDRLITQFISVAPTVEAVETGIHGSASVIMAGGYNLVLFPAGSHGEDWRIFKPGSNDEHFVISAGRIGETD
jgi:hypothetical protein